MKKLVLSLFFTVGIFALISQSEMLWSNRLLLDEPRIHTIQKGEYLSQLAKRYYGDAQRWRQLALINRAPNPDLVLPGEEILVPAVGPINELSRARTITDVKSLVGAQERFAVKETQEAARQFNGQTQSAPQSPEQQPAVAETSRNLPEADGVEMSTESEAITEVPLTAEVEAAAGFPWFWLAAGIMVVAGIIAFVRYRKQAVQEKSSGEESDNQVSRAEELIRDRRRHMEGAVSEA